MTVNKLREAGVSNDELEKTLFERLVTESRSRAPHAVCMLTVQHRMHPAIGQLISEVFYDGRLTHGTTEEERDHGLEWIKHSVTWLSTSRLAGRHEARRGTSFANAAEGEVIDALLSRLETDYRQLGLRKEVGIITGYSGQVAELVGLLEPSNGDRWQALDIEVATVDAFQGRDRDIVLYSTVRSNLQGVIGFLRDRRRLNVALSRARDLLFLIGNEAMFRAGSPDIEDNPFHAVLTYMDAHPTDCVVEDWAQKTIVQLAP